MKHRLKRIKELFGVLLFDWIPYRRALAAKDKRWLRLKNRYEVITLAPDGNGVRCEWKWTSILHAPTMYPSLGRKLFSRALKDYPFRVSDFNPVSCDEPKVSFVIGHRGKDRLSNLQQTIRSIANQKGVVIQCIVVEQDDLPRIRDELPAWIDYVHEPVPGNHAYSRASAFNTGAHVAKADLIVFHDNDLIVPECYAERLLEKYHEGYDVINLKRYIFYFSERSSRHMVDKDGHIKATAPEQIMQNAEAGGSIAISKAAFVSIGRFDEAFTGWGGEDNEFWERAKTKRTYVFGELPLIHLWHKPQSERLLGNDAPGVNRYHQLQNETVQDRIERLCKGAY